MNGYCVMHAFLETVSTSIRVTYVRKDGCEQNLRSLELNELRDTVVLPSSVSSRPWLALVLQ